MTNLPVDVSGLVDTETIEANDVLVPINDLKGHSEDTLDGVREFQQVNLGASSEVTISGGEIDLARDTLRVDTEGNAAADDLDTINGGQEGMLTFLRAENIARIVTVRHGAGNIQLPGGLDFALDDAAKLLPLFFNGTNWAGFGGGAGVMQRIAERTAIGSAAAEVAITDIPATYTHLFGINEFRSTRAAAAATLEMRMNGETAGTNYFSTYMEFSHNAQYATHTNSGSDEIRVGLIPADSAAAGHRALMLYWIANYKDPGLHRHLTGIMFSPFGNLEMFLFGGKWANSADPITELAWGQTTGDNFDADSAFTLYGIS